MPTFSFLLCVVLTPPVACVIAPRVGERRPLLGMLLYLISAVALLAIILFHP